MSLINHTVMLCYDMKVAIKGFMCLKSSLGYVLLFCAGFCELSTLHYANGCVSICKFCTDIWHLA